MERAKYVPLCDLQIDCCNGMQKKTIFFCEKCEKYIADVNFRPLLSSSK